MATNSDAAKDRVPADASIAVPAIPAGSDYPSSTCLAPEAAAAIQSKLELLIRQEASSKPDSPANPAATPTAAAGRMASPSTLGRRRLWRTLAFGGLLVGSLAIAATAYTRVERESAALMALELRSTDAEAAIGRLQRTADSARPPVDRLQQEAAGSRAEVARLKAEIATIAEAQAPLLARLDRQQADFTTRIEALRKTAAGDAQVQRLQTEVATLLQEQAPLVAEMRTQGTDLGTRIDGLLEEAIRDRTELARLKEQVIGISQSLPRTAVAPDPQQRGLIDEVAKLQQEILANRTGLRRLEGEFDTIKRASLQKPPDTELNTSSIGPGGPGTGTPQGLPGSRSPVVATLPAEVALPDAVRPRVVPRVARKTSTRSTAAQKRSPRAPGLDVKAANVEAIKRARLRRKPLDPELNTSSVAPGEPGTQTPQGPSRVVATLPADVVLQDAVSPRVVVRWCLRQPCRW